MELTPMGALVVAVLGGLTNLIVAVSILVRVLRTEAKVEHTANTMNGRLDMLLAEQERRLRAEAKAEFEGLKASLLAGTIPGARPEGIIRLERKTDPAEQ